MDNFIEKIVNKPIVISVPNKDTNIAPGIVCHKEALLKAYVDKIGSEFDFLGVPKKIVDVQKTDEYIIIFLE
ncbi:MAG: hypothetical protein K0S61_80 [Anaerocolumna sp.]|nr:hypothetical protein [Anaerocolumna sp.]